MIKQFMKIESNLVIWKVIITLNYNLIDIPTTLSNLIGHQRQVKTWKRFNNSYFQSNRLIHLTLEKG
jgi:hypothetical protein